MTQIGTDLRVTQDDDGEIKLLPADVGLGNVTNDVQTQAAIVPNTTPSAGQVLVGNAGGTAYAPKSISGDGTLGALGALIITKTNGVVFGTMATQNASAVAITGGTITGLPLPTATTDAATKAYVDAVTSGLSLHTSARVATTVALTATYANGTAGVGATLTNSGALAALSLDGKVLALADRVLVKNQAAPAQNGLYTVTTAGSGAVAWVLTRATDFDQSAGNEVVEGAAVIISEGTTNAGTLWVETGAGPFTLGTTSLTFTELQAIPTGALLAANNLSDLVSAASARTNLGLGTIATHALTEVAQVANNLSDLASAPTARTNLAVPGLSTVNSFPKTQTATPQALTSGSGADFTSAQNWSANVNGGTFTISNPSVAPADASYIAILVTFTTANSLAFGTKFKTTGYTASTSGKDHLLFRYDSGADLYYLVGVRNAVAT